MDMPLLATLAVVLAFWLLKVQDQGRRIALLGRHLAPYQIEKHMEALTQGYLRALDESDPARRSQIWQLQQASEQRLCAQFRRFAADFARAGEAETRISTLPVYLPFAARWWPRASFDARRALAVHAQGIARLAEAGDAGLEPKARAYALSAEIFLMQHTCHWFCKSRTVASARMMARHQTPYAQLLDSVTPETRAAYGALVGH